MISTLFTVIIEKQILLCLGTVVDIAKESIEERTF
jgi:hypothetical protein